MMAVVIMAVLLAWVSSAVIRSFENKRRAEYARLEAMSKARAAQAKAAENMAKADEEIEYLKDKIKRLNRISECEELERDACIPGGREYLKHEKAVLALENQIRTATRQLEKAYDKRKVA